MSKHSDIKRLDSVRFLLGRLKPYAFKMVLSVISGILKEMSIIAAAGICAYMAAYTLTGQRFESFVWLWILGGCVIVRMVSTYFESYLSHDVAYHALVDYRVTLYDKFITLCPDILLKQRSGQVATTLMNDVEQLEWFYGHTVGYVVVVFIVCAAIFGFLLSLHWSLAVALLVSIVLIVIVPLIMKGKADAQGLESRNRLGEANSVTLEGINGMNEILTFNWQEKYKLKNKHFMQRLTDIQVIYAKRMGIEGGLLQAFSGLSAAAINILGIYLVFQGQLAVEWYAVVGTTVWLAYNPLLVICSLARTFGAVFGASKRVVTLMEAEPIIRDTGADVDVSKVDPEIEFKNVWFKYDNNGPDILKDVSFTVHPGEMIAMVGESGAGKTTSTSVLNRLWDINGGSVTVGGVDIRDMKLENLHDLTSVVLQDVYLFNESIEDNIKLGRPDATHEEVVEAAKQARVHDFIESLPYGYDTIVGERGVQMSGGQRQRIAIARALLKNSPILIMDEAVSNLDTKTDMEIQDTIRHLAHKKTILIVAHRLSTIKEADRIIVLKDGQIVESGKHEELLRKDGNYKELVMAQLKEAV